MARGRFRFFSRRVTQNDSSALLLLPCTVSRKSPCGTMNVHKGPERGGIGKTLEFFPGVNKNISVTLFRQ